MKRLRRGDVVAGVVMRADVDGIFINIGHKSEGVVPPSEMKTLEPEGLERIKEGDEIMTLVVKPETAEEGAVLSIDRAVGEQGWLALERKLQSSESVEGKIIGFNRGGAIVEVEGIQGFVPMSQLVSVSRDRTRERRDDTASQQVDEGAPEAEKGHDQEASSDDVGKALQLKVLEINRARNRAIFSERQLVQELREERKPSLSASSMRARSARQGDGHL